MVSTKEQNELSIQQVVQYYQEKEGDELHYHVLGLNESSKDDDMKKPIVTWFIDFTLKNHHSQASDEMLTINEANEELEDTLRHNDAIREQEHVRMAQSPCPHCPQMTCWKHLLMTHLIQEQDKNQPKQ